MTVFAAGSLAGCATDEADIDLATCSPDVYRIDRIQLPKTNSQSRELATDLDGRAPADNQLGIVIATLDTQFQPLDIVDLVNERLIDDVQWRIALRTCGDQIVVSTGRAEQLEAVQLFGPAGPGALHAAGPGAELPLSLMFDPDGAYGTPGWSQGVHSAITVERSSDGGKLSAKLGVAIESAAALDAIAPPLALFLDDHRAEQAYLMQYFDTNADGRIVEAELRASALLISLLAPDLMIGDAQAISLGIGITATRVP